jgi:hypothetical protein
VRRSRAASLFIECGDPHHGFARVYCDAYYLLAYSCKTRYFCPSCHQKRVLLYGEWLEENVLEPVPHRQYVFTLPRLLRPIFGRHRPWLGELCRIAARLLVDAYAEAAPGARPGLIRFVQTFGDLANFNPHLHVLAANGAFLADGTFVALPAVPEELLAEGFRRAVLKFLAQNDAISEDLRSKLLGWRYRQDHGDDRGEGAVHGRLPPVLHRRPADDPAQDRVCAEAPPRVVYTDRLLTPIRKYLRPRAHVNVGVEGPGRRVPREAKAMAAADPGQAAADR